MKNGKQRRGEIMAKRKKRGAAVEALPTKPIPNRMVPVNENLLAPNNSYGAPAFVMRGYYVDIPFRCVGCGKEEIWTGGQQKWWYEVAKGFVYSSAIRCRACRREARAQREEARRVQRNGLARKEQARKANKTEKSS